MPGPEALLNPGKKEGDVLVLKSSNDIVEAYQWVGSKQCWDKIGDVVYSTTNSSKQMFEGKEYDYVFKIDIEDGKPPLSLPYNVSENPYSVAQSFIHLNQLPISYLDEISNFIIKNSKGVTLAQSLSTGDPLSGTDLSSLKQVSSLVRNVLGFFEKYIAIVIFKYIHIPISFRLNILPLKELILKD